MIRPLRTTVALAVITAASAAFILTVEREDDSRRASLTSARAAFHFNPARVSAIRIRTASATLTAVRSPADDSRWSLTSPLAARADASSIERLLLALRDLPSDDLILPPVAPQNPAAAYAPYGLDAPPVAIDIFESSALQPPADTTRPAAPAASPAAQPAPAPAASSLPSSPTLTFLLGRRTPLGDGLYARIADAPGITRLAPGLLDLVPSSAEALRSRSLLQGDPASIGRLDIRAPAGYLQLARKTDTGAWFIFQPFSSRADASAVASLLDALFASSIEQFVQDNVADLAPYGLDPQSAVTAILNLSDNSGSQVLSLGDPLPNAPYLVYARIQGESSIYAVPAALRTALLVRPDDLRDRRVPGLDAPSDIQRIRIDAPPAPPLEAFRDPDGLWFLASPLRAPANPAAIGALFDALASVRLTAFPAHASDPDSPDAPPPPDAFVRTIRVTLASDPDAPVTLRVAPATAAPDAVPGLTQPSAWLAIASDSTLALSTPDTLLSTPVTPEPYLSLDILDIPPSDLAAIEARGPATADDTPAPAATYVHLADDTWSPPLPADLLPLLAPLRADSILPTTSPDAPSDAPPPALTLTFRLRGATGIAHILTLLPAAAGDAAPARLRGRPYDFLLPHTTVDAFLALLPAP